MCLWIHPNVLKCVVLRIYVGSNRVAVSIARALQDARSRIHTQHNIQFIIGCFVYYNHYMLLYV